MLINSLNFNSYTSTNTLNMYMYLIFPVCFMKLESLNRCWWGTNKKMENSFRCDGLSLVNISEHQTSAHASQYALLVISIRAELQCVHPILPIAQLLMFL